MPRIIQRAGGGILPCCCLALEEDCRSYTRILLPQFWNQIYLHLASIQNVKLCGTFVVWDTLKTHSNDLSVTISHADQI